MHSQPPAKVLIIPHQPNRNIKVRAVEMAKHLASLGHYQVFILTWQINPKPSRHIGEKIIQKSLEALKTTRIRPKTTEENGLTWVELPYLLAPTPWCQAFNQRQLKRFVQQHGIELIISGNAYHFPMPIAPYCRRIYDVVDDHISPGSGPDLQTTRQFTLQELKKADHITTISHALQDLLNTEGFAGSSRIPNGVDYAAFQQTPYEKIQAIRTQHQLDGRFTIGYIGNHGPWAGMELLLDAFERLQQRLPKSRLLIIGPGEDLPRWQSRIERNAGITATGPIPPPEIATWFHAVDIGVLPFAICPFTDNALPLKLLEYGAARKTVLATPLKELKTLQLPHVRLIEPNAQDWSAALMQEAENPTPWQPQWNEVIAGYDWATVLKDLPKLLTKQPEQADAAVV